jgi:hypothetical protein
MANRDERIKVIVVRGHRIGITHLALLASLAACAPAGAPQPTPPHLLQLREWRFETAEHVALWYHALAHTGSAAVGRQTTLPLHDSVYVARVAAARRAAGVAETALERRAAEFATTFRGSTAYQQLEFVPLYFENTDALLTSLRVWEQVGGDPRRAGSGDAAAAVNLLSSMFPQPAQRRALSEWRELLEEERQVFFASYWNAQQPALRELAAAAAAEWAPLAGPLQPLLAYLRLQGGVAYVVPSLGPEGRLLPRGGGVPRIAVAAHGSAADGMPNAGPREIVFSFLHELLYPLAGDAVSDHVAPARVREIGAAVLELNTAVRAGALALAHAAPDRLDDYYRYYIAAAGQPVPAGATDRERAFGDLFALPPELEAGLARVVEQALAGI